MKKYLYILSLLSLFVITSCKSKQSAAEISPELKTEQAMFGQVIANHFSFEAVQSKIKLGLGKNNLNGKICLESNKRFGMLINAPLIGFEIGRVEATKEVIILVDKFDKVYSNITLKDLSMPQALVGHEAEALEALFLARIYLPGKGLATIKDFASFKWEKKTAIYKDPDYRLIYSFGENGMLSSTELVSNDGKSVKWEYDEYRELESGKFMPSNQSVNIRDEKGEGYSFSLNITNPSLGESTWREFKPTSSFREVTITELGETLKKHAK